MTDLDGFFLWAQGLSAGFIFGLVFMLRVWRHRLPPVAQDYFWFQLGLGVVVFGTGLALLVLR